MEIIYCVSLPFIILFGFIFYAIIDHFSGDHLSNICEQIINKINFLS